MKDVPRSSQFDDIYFSAEDGLAETAHVFLEGNELPAAWQGEVGQEKDSFTICETGFGTGLNFFSVWKLFEENSEAYQHLDFISIEKYPLTPEEIKKALSEWRDYFGGRIDILCKKYPIRVAGFHQTKITDRITLTLIFDDINEALLQVDAKIDCWFLDGFTPAKNPDMWRKTLYQEMARLSVTGARYATFTAAADVRRGLETVGFSVEKKDGFGRKRDMIAGRFLKGKKENSSSKSKKSIAIIGGGLAGTSCAYVLKQYGYEPVIYERGESLASGASGNPLGLYNPRFSKFRDNLSHFFASSYAQIIGISKQAGKAIDYTPCGALHLINDKRKADRYHSMARNWYWQSDHVKVVGSAEASVIAGIPIGHEALYLKDSGSVSPQKLCDYYAQGIEVHVNTTIKSLKDIKEDIIILACGGAVKNFEELSWLPLETVRGQISYLKETPLTKKINCNILYGGYLSCAKEGVHTTGSTFEKWTDDLALSNKSHQGNIKNLQDHITALSKENFEITGGRAGIRAATNDRFPVVGPVPHHKNLYVSAAFGSHGIVGSLTAAHLIADYIRGGALSLPMETAYELSPRRFIDRAAKKGRVLV